MKKTLTAILSIIFVFCFVFSTFADNTEQLTYTYDDFNVIFDEDTPFDSAQRQKIADILANGSESAETAGILCIFGHDWQQDMIITITHCAREEQPRCLKEYFDIYMCSRCEKTKTELISQTYFLCCD